VAPRPAPRSAHFLVALVKVHRAQVGLARQASQQAATVAAAAAAGAAARTGPL
jgi:hypothetical protein